MEIISVGSVSLFLTNIFWIKDVFARANEYNLSDCAHYFLSNVKRLSDVGYVPTTQDILHTRVKTSGIVEVSYILNTPLIFHPITDSYH